MRELTPEEKRRLREIIDEQSAEQEKKWQDYREFRQRVSSLDRMPGSSSPDLLLKPSKHHISVWNGLASLEGKHEETAKRSELKDMHLKKGQQGKEVQESM